MSPFNVNKILQLIIAPCIGAKNFMMNFLKKFIFKRLVEHFGRIVSSNSCSFTGEIVEDHSWSLLNEINKKQLIKIQKRKKYSEYEDLCVTFTVYR